jgi:hypothetical protein
MNTELQRAVINVIRVAAILEGMERRFRTAPGDIVIREYAETVQALMPAIGSLTAAVQRTRALIAAGKAEQSNTGRVLPPSRLP